MLQVQQHTMNRPGSDRGSPLSLGFDIQGTNPRRREQIRCFERARLQPRGMFLWKSRAFRQGLNRLRKEAISWSGGPETHTPGAEAPFILLALSAGDPDPEGPPVPRSCPDTQRLPEEFVCQPVKPKILLAATAAQSKECGRRDYGVTCAYEDEGELVCQRTAPGTGCTEPAVVLGASACKELRQRTDSCVLAGAPRRRRRPREFFRCRLPGDCGAAGVDAAVRQDSCAGPIAAEVFSGATAPLARA